MIKNIFLFTSLFAISLGVLSPSLEANDDTQREAIVLPVQDRNLVLAEMRSFLEAVQSITSALVEKDMKTISQTARKMGMANARTVPAALIVKLPKQFRQLATSTHKQFDDIAIEASDFGDRDVILKKLSDLMLNCTACHATYKLVPQNGDFK